MSLAYVNVKKLSNYANLNDFLSDTTFVYPENQILSVAGFLYKVASPSAVDFHVATSSGTKLYVLPENGVYRDTAFGVVHDNSTDNAISLQKAVTAASNAVLEIATGTAVISDAIQLPTTITIRGSGSKSVVKMTGTNKTHFYGSGTQKIKISDLFFEGNQTGIGDVGPNGGSGIYLANSEYTEISGCFFDKIGAATGATSSVCIGVLGSKVSIKGNVFLPLCRSVTGADIGCGTTSDTIITNNISYSEMDAFVSLSSVSVEPDGKDVIRHIVANNIASRQNENARSAILALYQANPGLVSISNNVLEGFIWNGIYMSAGVPAAKTEPGGGATISGNIIRFCAGGGTISTSIYIAGEAGTSATGNYIEYHGFTRLKVARAFPVPAINVLQYSKNVSVVGNTIRDSAFSGINVGNFVGGVENVVVSGNAILNHRDTGISVSSQQAGTNTKNVRVQGNVTQTNYNANGCAVLLANSGTVENVVFSNNTFVNTLSGNTSIGFSSARFPGVIENNIFDGFATGIRLTGGTDRSLLRTLIVKGNEYRNCATARTLSTNNTRQISLDDRFVNCTSLGGTVDLRGTQIGVNASGEILVEVALTATPPNGEWLAGDRVLNLTPTAGGTIGWVCVTSGSPGTWKTFGAISA